MSRISTDEWVWITRQNRQQAERALEEARYEEREARKAAGLPPLLGSIVRVDNQQFTGYGIAEYDTGDRKRAIGVKLENGNVWEYDADTVRFPNNDEASKIPNSILKLAKERKQSKEKNL